MSRPGRARWGGGALRGLGGWLLMRARLAWACASCAARPDEGHRTAWFIAAMVTLPLVVGGGTLLIVRGLDRRDRAEQRPEQER